MPEKSRPFGYANDVALVDAGTIKYAKHSLHIDATSKRIEHCSWFQPGLEKPK